MSMTLDDLRKVFHAAFEAKGEENERTGGLNLLKDCERAGIRAVVGALAPDDDEIAAYNRLSYKVREQLKCECDYLPEDRCIRCSVMEALKCLETRFNDILGDAGNEKAAEKTLVERVEEEARKPVAYKPNFPAADRSDDTNVRMYAEAIKSADPSPEVCEWTLQSVATADVEGFNGIEIWRTPHKTVYFHEVGHKPITCGRCSKPIAFKEARP